MQSPNVDSAEVHKFSDIAVRWWDPESEFRPLHLLNPLRLGYIQDHSPVEGMRILDVGCGGGILSESLAESGAKVTGIDVGEETLEVARLHLLESGIKVEYVCSTVEDYAKRCKEKFDIVTCMELLEHVPDPASIISACALLVRPGGSIYFSTLNRTPKSWLLGIVGAEYILRLIPRGTHQHRNFIRPSELNRWCLQSEITMQHMTGMHYNPLTRSFRLGPGVDVNYLAHCIRT